MHAKAFCYALHKIHANTTITIQQHHNLHNHAHNLHAIRFVYLFGCAFFARILAVRLIECKVVLVLKVYNERTHTHIRAYHAVEERRRFMKNKRQNLRLHLYFT